MERGVVSNKQNYTTNESRQEYGFYIVNRADRDNLFSYDNEVFYGYGLDTREDIQTAIKDLQNSYNFAELDYTLALNQLNNFAQQYFRY